MSGFGYEVGTYAGRWVLVGEGTRLTDPLSIDSMKDTSLFLGSCWNEEGLERPVPVS